MNRRITDLLLAFTAIVMLGGAATYVRRAKATGVSRESQFTRRKIADGPSVARDGQLFGSRDAATRLVVFTDFQCPYCRALHQTLGELLARDSTAVAVVYRHFPLPGNNWSFMAARASECAAEQGRFRAYADVLFAKQDSLGRASWEQMAADAGVRDTVAFRTCRHHPRSEVRVDADRMVGTRLAITGTPAIVLGEELMTGAAPLDTLDAWLRRVGSARD